MTLLPFFIAVYVSGMLVYSYWMMQRIDPRFLAIARRGTNLAAGMAVSFLGSAILWPLMVLVLGWIRLNKNEEPGYVLDGEIEDIVDNPPPIEPVDIASVLPRCGACGERQAMPERTDGVYLPFIEGAYLTVMSGSSYWVCDFCTHSLGLSEEHSLSAPILARDPDLGSEP